jgi:hypothetical protein
MRGWVVVAVAALLLSGTACDNGGNPVQVIGGASGVRVDVSEGVTPTYAWLGGRARVLSVQTSTGDVFWEVESIDPLDGFDSPARHGVTPVGARVVVPSRVLDPGVVYIVTVITVQGNRGFRTFTPVTLIP